jgi:hypothetical protein
MAEALTDWEISNGGLLAYDNADVTWIEVIENFTDDMLQRSIETGGILNALTTLRQIQILQPAAIPLFFLRPGLKRPSVIADGSKQICGVL